MSDYQQRLRGKLREWGIEGVNEALVCRALMHPSFDLRGKKNNQRLEYLGDAVLDLVIGEYLFLEYPDWHEGELTRSRSQLAQERTLARVALTIGLDTVLLLGKGEEKDGGRRRPSTLADALESLIAAVYLSLGLGATEKFVLRYFAGLEKQARDDQEEVCRDHKTELQEYVQKRYPDNVSYEILREEGPPHRRVFTAAVFHRDKQIGWGKGATKKAAEKAAARVGLATLKRREHDGEA